MAASASNRTVSPPWALGLCDRCGFPYKLNELQYEVYDQRPNGLKTCPVCTDKDNPQLQLGRYPVDDNQSLRDPRQDVGVPGSTGLFGWLPIGSPLVINSVQCFVGNITVVVI